jgi:ubiquitin-activating enzyme E1
MVQATEEVKIDTDLYSRQIGTFGLETMGKLVKMKVAIIGCRGLGVETAKNLILAGPAQVDVYDPTTV